MHARALALALVLASLAACSPPPAPDPWKEGAYTVQPQTERPPAQGFVQVETALVIVPETRRLGELAPRRYARCRIYDRIGHFIREVEGYEDETPPRIPLAPGNYIVSTKLDLEWRSVQFVVQNDRTTLIHLADFRHGQRRPADEEHDD